MAKLKVVLLEDRYASHEHERKVLEKIGAQVIEGNQVKTAKLLGISRAMLHERMEKFGLL